MANPCYKVVADHVNLCQGDILLKCPCVELLANPLDYSAASVHAQVPVETIDYDVAEYDAIILSQSCDLQPRKNGMKNGQDKIVNVVLCPIYPLKEFEKKQHETSMRKELSKGRRIGFYLLPATPNEAYFNGDFLVVDFHNTFSLPIGIVRQLILPKGRRLRIRSPYRESLSQAFARFFMRVALPDEI